METVQLRKEPTNAMRYPKNGIVSAITTVLATNKDLMDMLIALLLSTAKQVSIADAMGVTIKAYFVKGLNRVMYMATMELGLPTGRLSVICELNSCPYIRYPAMAIAP